MTPTDQLEARRTSRRRAPTWSSRRLRDYRTEHELGLERRRQDLRDQRWRRWRSMLITGLTSTMVVTGQIPIKDALKMLLAQLGAG